MRLDKKEFHVLEELQERFKIDTCKFLKLVEKRQVAVLYKSKQGRMEVCCTILFLDSVSGCSNEYSEVHYTSHCNDKEPKFVERIGRMVAFSGAVLKFLGAESLPGGELESIARSKTELIVPAQISEFSSLSFGPSKTRKEKNGISI